MNFLALLHVFSFEDAAFVCVDAVLYYAIIRRIWILLVSFMVGKETEAPFDYQSDVVTFLPDSACGNAEIFTFQPCFSQNFLIESLLLKTHHFK